MHIRESVRRASGLLLLAVVFVMTSVATAAAAPEGPRHDYIVTLDVTDAGKALKTSAKRGRQRMRARARATRDTARRLAKSHDFRIRHRYGSAVAGFSARLTVAEAARIRRDPSVAAIRPAQRYRVASQVVPAGMKRTRAIRSGGPRPDVDADIAVLDTGVGPVGGDELEIKGGVNCSADGRGDDAWDDLFSSHHGTHVAGIAAARDNGIGSIGVAPGARVWSVRVFTAGGFGTEATIICGLDWVVATHSGSPPAGTQPIEVVNMSLQGPRLPIGPDACGVAEDPDAMHVAICSVHAAGITMVVAAGNNGTDANRISPAAYQQVITVGSMNDFDGKPGSLGKACEFWAREKDDRYAGYSNYGDRVDIVAPGTCVRSTQPSADGDLTSLLTGTSMATPHVAGAVARYLAKHPATAPDAMRDIVRAAGRLDWAVGSDPNAGPVPLRLLDVKALNGDAHVRPWVRPGRARLGAGRRSQTFRVDVQRHGGYGGDVTLDVTGLPDGVTDGEYEPGRTLSSRSQLGASMTLTSERDGDDFNGKVRIRASGQGGTPSGGRKLPLIVDRTGPRIRDLSARIRSGGQPPVAGNRVAVRVQWKAFDVATSVAGNRLQKRTGKRNWTTVAAGRKTRSGKTRVKPGTNVSFRVRATDTIGNQTKSKIAMRLGVRDSSSPKISSSGDSWVEHPNVKAIGGGVIRSGVQTATLTSSFEGNGIAVVAPLGPGHGRLRVRVDGGAWKTIVLRRRKSAPRRVVYSRALAPGDHVIELRPLSGRPAVDALIISH